MNRRVSFHFGSVNERAHGASERKGLLGELKEARAFRPKLNQSRDLVPKKVVGVVAQRVDH
jgi:hypothetical protein